MVRNGGRGAFVSPVRVSVYGGGECAKLLVQLVLELLHGISEMFFGEGWVGVGGIIHSLNFLRDGLPRGSLG